MFIGIVGARKYKDRQSVIDLVKGFPTDTVVITGSCKGPCTWAAEEAKARGLRIKAFSPNLENVHGRFDVAKRYYKNNRKLIQASDVVHAFISKEGGFTGGTKFEVEYALKLGMEVSLHWERSVCQNVCQYTFPFIRPEAEFFSDWKAFFQDTFV